MTFAETDSLTPKQEAFARHYAASGNGAAAARAAGYSAQCARQQAHETLRKAAVQARVATLAAAFADTARREAAILLERLEDAFELASRKADYRAMLEITRLQARLGGLMPDRAGRHAGDGHAPATAAVLYDEAGGPGPVERARRGWPATGDPDFAPDEPGLEPDASGAAPDTLGLEPGDAGVSGPDTPAPAAGRHEPAMPPLPGEDRPLAAAASRAPLAGRPGDLPAGMPACPDIPLHIRTPRPAEPHPGGRDADLSDLLGRLRRREAELAA